MFLDKIKKLCKKNKITIHKLEKECDLGNGTIRGWEKSIPNVNTLQKVADYFQIPVTYFLEEEG